MTFLNTLGDRAAAIRAYEAFVSRLAEEYELEPSRETNALAAAIRDGEPPSPASRPARPSEPAAGVAPRRHRRTRALAGVLSGAALVGAIGVGIVMHRHSEVSAPPQAPRILVLPFQNLGAAEDVYFTDGITDEITARLATVKGLSVVGGQAAQRYRGSRKTPRQMAEETHADYVLEGTVSWQRARRGPGRVRVRPQLINAHDETQVWAAVMDHDVNMTELFALLSGVTQRVVDELHLALEPRQQRDLTVLPTTNLDAYDYYLRGRTFAHGTWSTKSNLPAIQMFEPAVARDSELALACARFSVPHTHESSHNTLS